MEVISNSSQNYLLNKVVLERLFDHIKLDTVEFKKCRLVCKLWFKTSLQLWRKTVELRVGNISSRPSQVQFDYYLRLLDTEEGEIGYFLQVAKYPFKRYIIKDWEVSVRAETANTELEFFEKVGTLMTHLTICHSVFNDAQDFRRILFEFTPNLEGLCLCENIYKCNRWRDRTRRLNPKSLKKYFTPANVQENLKQVKLELEQTSIGVQVGTLNHEFPVSWMEFFAHFPAIQSLELVNLFPCDGEMILTMEELQELLKSMEIVRSAFGPQYFAGLKDLSLINMLAGFVWEYPPGIISSLEELRFPLKTFSFDAGCNSKMETFTQILRMGSESLEDLKIYRDEEPDPFSLPPMDLIFPNLTSLTLIGSIFPGLQYLKQMPNLVSLHSQKTLSDTSYKEACLEEYDGFDNRSQISNADLAHLNGFVLNKLKKFSVGEGVWTSEQIRVLGTLMPNLDHLRLGLENKGFELVCQTWPNLERLEIHPFEVTEEGILGTVNGNNYAVPNITTLQFLTRFRMGYLVLGDDCGRLTNASILNGFFHLNYLKRVELCLGQEVSNNVYEQLLSRILRTSSMVP